ncbi:MAG: hypothetical protein DRI44_05760 [Chlamydiae bacterium]|nr:MAG: hypothetical protein DRI44_05760 [Chlamydiota bacterium]
MNVECNVVLLVVVMVEVVGRAGNYEYVLSFNRNNYYHVLIRKDLRDTISRLKREVKSEFRNDFAREIDIFTNTDIIRVVILLREKNKLLFDEIVREIVAEKKKKLESKKQARKKARKKKKKKVKVNTVQ